MFKKWLNNCPPQAFFPFVEALWWLFTSWWTQRIWELLHLTQQAWSTCSNILSIGFYKFDGKTTAATTLPLLPQGHIKLVAGGSSAGSSGQWRPPLFISPQLSCQESIGDHNVGSAAGRSVLRLPCKYFILDSRQGAFKDVCWTMLPSRCPLEVTGLAF